MTRCKSRHLSFTMKAPLISLLLFLALIQGSSAAEPKLAKAVFGAGCFWCVEVFFEQQPGVTQAVSGYAGGDESNPKYEQVSAGKTGHAEVVEVTYDPARTSYEALLTFFWKTHDVTDPRGVSPDFGRQYRSTILTQDDAQAAVAKKSKAEAQKNFRKPIATEIASLRQFWPAEEYHQDYIKKNPRDKYVREIAIPKLKKLGLKPPL